MAHEHQASILSKSCSIEEVADFWDTHDAADHDDQTQRIEIEFDLETRRHDDDRLSTQSEHTD